MRSRRRGAAHLVVAAVIVVFLTCMVRLAHGALTSDTAEVKVSVIPHIVQGPNWQYCIDIYSHNAEDTVVTVDYQDDAGNILRTDEVLIPPYSHQMISSFGAGLAPGVRTIIVTGNGATMVTAYQTSVDKAGKVNGVSAAPVYEDCTLGN